MGIMVHIYPKKVYCTGGCLSEKPTLWNEEQAEGKTKVDFECYKIINCHDTNKLQSFYFFCRCKELQHTSRVIMTGQPTVCTLYQHTYTLKL